MCPTNFGYCLSELKAGNKMRRSGWSDKGMWIWLGIPDEGTWRGYKRLPYIYIKTADNCVVPWVASQVDILAEDWEIVQS